MESGRGMRTTTSGGAVPSGVRRDDSSPLSHSSSESGSDSEHDSSFVSSSHTPATVFSTPAGPRLEIVTLPIKSMPRGGGVAHRKLPRRPQSARVRRPPSDRGGGGGGGGGFKDLKRRRRVVAQGGVGRLGSSRSVKNLSDRQVIQGVGGAGRSLLQRCSASSGPTCCGTDW